MYFHISKNFMFINDLQILSFQLYKVCYNYKIKMETASLTQKKNTYTILYQNTKLKFSGDFDSGNLNWASVDYQKQQIQLLFGKDKEFKPSSKCWFYFSIQGTYNYLPVKLCLLKVNSLSPVAKIFDLYRPVVRVQGGQWERHSSPVDFQITSENDINFRMTVDLYNSKRLQIALCYPWTIEDNDRFINKLKSDLSQRKDIYFNSETLIYSVQKRPIQLLAISSNDVKNNSQQEYMDHIFPNRQTQAHLKMIKKPMILITARVHPGQIGSSYALKGMLQYLISGIEDAKKMLNQFYFLIVPILNPDGVFLGNNRMDSLGQNLNRFYHLPDIEKQPSCYAIKSLVQLTRRQLFAFFDLHGHANKKSCFLFGNYIGMPRLQTDSVLFAKYLSTICDYIEFKACNFSKKQMSSRDKNEDFSKQGCARVVVHRWTNSPYCYTLQTGLYKNVRVDDKGIQRYGDKFYSPIIYQEVGSKMFISLFTILKKNKQMDELRKSLSNYILKLQKTNTKKQKTESKKQVSAKQLLPPSKSSTTELKKIKSEKQNSGNKEKITEIEQILQINKNYLMEMKQFQQYDD